MSQSTKTQTGSRPTPTIEDYLAVIYVMERDEGEAVAARLAESLEVAPSTVTVTLKRMERDGWVAPAGGKGTRLTEKGCEAARSVLRRHMLTEWMLARMLKVPWSRVHSEANRIEHTISDPVETQMRANLNDPQLCPHGNPLPGYEYVAASWLALTGMPRGAKVIIRRVHETAEANPELLEFLETHGIVPGAPAEVTDILTFNQTLSLTVAGQSVALGFAAAGSSLWSKRHDTHRAEVPLMQLLEVQPGAHAVVRRLEGGRSVLSRLAALGFTPGAAVQVLRSSEHGPLLVTLRGSRVALGQGEAAHVYVSVAENGLLVETETPLKSSFSIALTGQPNVGKSSVFNALTGLNQHVGNWTGKTIECKVGAFSFKGMGFSVVDLPGTYSLTASSEEERLARDYIIKEHPDLIVAVVNAATLERSLYLVAELLLLPVPMVVALNMTDVAEQEGIQVEPKVLEAALGVPVVPMVASKGAGLVELEETVLQMTHHAIPYQPKRPLILPAHQSVLDELRGLIGTYVLPSYPEEWVALKLLEGDEELTGLMKTAMPPEAWEKVHALLYQHEDAILDIAGARYEWVARIIRAAVVEPKVTRVGTTTRLDRVLTHPLWGTLALIAILGGAFWLTYQVGSPIQAWLSQLINLLAHSIRSQWAAAPGWLVEFFAGGVLGGIGMVLTFLPILAIFFTVLGLLEDTGYMARAAYLSDRWMHMMGLHGKSFMPILLGFGCNVPAILGTRIIESRRARLLTILLIPLVPCTARMAVIAILAAVFFGPYAFWISWGLVGCSLLVLAGLGLILHQFFFGNEHVPFIMELPLYHFPNLRTIGIYVWDNLLGFLKKAGTTILVATLFVWAFSYFPTGNVMTSYLGGVGKFLEPVGSWIGLPWPVLVALLTSFVAKENTVATLGVLYGSLNVLTTVMTPVAMLAFLVFQILFIPCVGTVAAIHQETRSWRWTASSVGMQLAISLGLAVAVYQIGRLF